jgi:hypothetical protein
MLKFLLAKGLAFLVDFSSASIDAIPDTSGLDLEDLLATLRQCPSYQVDKHHVNCGPRLRIEPILDYIRAMLSANVVSIAYADWKRDRAVASWATSPARQEESSLGPEHSGTFMFTRAMANDQRLRLEGNMYADRMAKKLFTSESWDWTPEA